jgi:hypothetical protein
MECKYLDKTCPCQDGDLCHYEGENPMRPPQVWFDSIWIIVKDYDRIMKAANEDSLASDGLEMIRAAIRNSNEQN